MSRNAIWAAVFSLLAFADGVWSADEDPVDKALAAERSEYEKAKAKAKGKLLEELSRKAEAAQKVGDLKGLEKIEGESKAFVDLGELPKSVPTKPYESDLRKAQARLEVALTSAVTALTKAGRRAEAKDVQQELDELKAASPHAVEQEDLVKGFQKDPVRFLTSRKWDFGAENKVFATLGFEKDGTISGAKHPNEHTWILDGLKNLVTVSKSGNPLIKYTKVRVEKGKLVLSGTNTGGKGLRVYELREVGK